MVEVTQSAREMADTICNPTDDPHMHSILCKKFAQAEARGREAGLREAAKAIERANDRVMGIETPAMQGDNLAVTLCSHFEDDGDDEDDNGWNEAATTGYEEVRAAIQNHYSAAIANLIPGEKA